jgi:hypothetical protein
MLGYEQSSSSGKYVFALLQKKVWIWNLEIDSVASSEWVCFETTKAMQFLALLVLIGAVLIGVHWSDILLPHYTVPAPGSAVVITGTSTGIGQSAAKRLAELGFIVYAGVRKQQQADVVAKIHRNIRPVLLDVTIPQNISAVREKLEMDGVKLAGLIVEYFLW